MKSTSLSIISAHPSSNFTLLPLEFSKNTDTRFMDIENFWGNSGERICQIENIEITPKTPAEVFGERIVGPTIQYTVQLFSKIGYGLQSIASVLQNTLTFPTAEAGEIPVGTVAYFDKQNCPDGWVKRSDLIGRVLIGQGNYVGTAQDGRQEIQGFNLGETGGEISHRITERGFLIHTHAEPDALDWQYVSSVVGGQPHNNLPPYKVLTVCEKSFNPNEKVGIGTSNPQASLDVRGIIRTQEVCNTDGSACIEPSQLSGTVIAQKNQIEALQRQLEILQSHIEALQSQLEISQSHIEALQSQLEIPQSHYEGQYGIIIGPAVASLIVASIALVTTGLVLRNNCKAAASNSRQDFAMVHNQLPSESASPQPPPAYSESMSI